MSRTIVGVFDESAAANKAASELRASGIPDNHVQVKSNGEVRAAGSKAAEPSWTEKIVNFFESMFDDESDKRHAHTYAEAWRRGHDLVVADIENDRVDAAVAIMNRNGAIDIERRAEQWKKTGYSGSYDRSAAPYTAEQRANELGAMKREQTEAIPVVQEEMAIGKQVVQRGGVRIHSYVKERPVEEVVRLREERVNVVRRPVDRPATDADMTFQERTVNVTAQGEEAVAQKRARVVEEVVVGKDVQQREETVRDTVRRKDVDVENIEGTRTKSAANQANVNNPGPRR